MPDAETDDLHLQATAVPGLPPPKVLVVDDDEDMLKLLVIALEKAGYSVAFATTGRRALERLKEPMKPDAIVLDWNLPDADGVELCGSIRNDPETAKIPVLLLTAMKGNENRIKASAAKPDVYLEKPIKPGDFLKAVETALRASGPRSQRRGIIDLGALKLRPDDLQVSYHGRSCTLSRSLFGLLYLLAENRPAVLSVERLHRQLCRDRLDNEVRVLVSDLRAATRKAFGIDFVETVHGAGYRLCVPSRPPTPKPPIPDGFKES